MALKKNDPRTKNEKTVKGVRVIENTAANQLQLVFHSKPSDRVIHRLQLHSFHWFVKDFAWQRLLNPIAIYEAERFLAWYEPDK